MNDKPTQQNATGHRIRWWRIVTMLVILSSVCGCRHHDPRPTHDAWPESIEASWVELLSLSTDGSQLQVAVPRVVHLPALTTMAIGVASGGHASELTAEESASGQRRLYLDRYDPSEERWHIVRGPVRPELFQEALRLERLEFAPLRDGGSATSGLYSEVLEWNLIPQRMSDSSKQEQDLAWCRVRRRVWVEGLPPGALVALCEVILPLTAATGESREFLAMGIAVLEHDVIRLGPENQNGRVLGAWAMKASAYGTATVPVEIVDTLDRKAASSILQLYCYRSTTLIPVASSLDPRLPISDWAGVDWDTHMQTLKANATRVGEQLQATRPSLISKQVQGE